MIELKLSQGAKPGHGGILPAAKLTREIAEIRKVPMGKDVLLHQGIPHSRPPSSCWSLSASCERKAAANRLASSCALERGENFWRYARPWWRRRSSQTTSRSMAGRWNRSAPLEFSNHIGAPLFDGLIFVHNALVGFALRRDIRILASGKVTSGFGMVKRLALGPDGCYSARGMMLALGNQALKCNSNDCPVGVATQNPHLMAGLVPTHKSQRVANFHREDHREPL